MRRNWLICALLAAVTLAVYWRTTNYPFISYDDPEYVSTNTHVQQGLTLQGIRWAFTTGAVSNYHPLTWLSLMLDWQIAGYRPGYFHFINLSLHVANTLLLYLAFTRLMQSSWRSAIVAALFALHPLHVQSVAWIAERKDVLSTFFMFLALLCYERYARTGKPRWYWSTFTVFALGLLAKPMLITLPVILLLLDIWPLRRIKTRCAIPEKLPFLVVAFIASMVTFLVQRAGGAVAGVDKFPLSLRFTNAVVSYIRYLEKMIWPANLAVFNPMPDFWPFWQVSLCLAALILITLSAIRMRDRAPWLLVGWLWYIIMLLPVIGIIQVGDQAMADRYTYVPLVGIFIMLIWSIPERLNRPAIVAGATGILALSIVTWREIGYWQNSETLFRRAADSTYDNWLAYNHLATAFADQQRFDDALLAAQTAVKIHPAATTWFNLGNTFRRTGDRIAAIDAYQRAMKLDNRRAVIPNNYGITLAESGRLPEAEELFRRAIAIDRNYADAHANLGLALAQQGNLQAAKDELNEALRLNPDHRLALQTLRQLAAPPPLPQ